MLATYLLESASCGAGLSNPSRYSHDEGMTAIAMESALELRDLYESVNYALDDLTFTHYAAMQESASEEVLENILTKAAGKVKSGLAKIGELLAKLKNKIKEFVNGIRRWFFGLRKSGQEFVDRYEKQIKALNLTGYKIEMYDFDKMETFLNNKLKTSAEAINTSVEGFNKAATAVAAKDSTNTDSDVNTAKTDQANTFANLLPANMNDDEYSQTDVAKASLNAMLGGTYDVKGKPNTVLKSLTGNAIVNGFSSGEEFLKSIDTTFDKVLKSLTSAETSCKKAESAQNGFKEADANYKTNTNGIAMMTVYVSSISKMQGIINAHISAAKQAVTMKNKAYRDAATGAFKYARKNKTN